MAQIVHTLLVRDMLLFY